MTTFHLPLHCPHCGTLICRHVDANDKEAMPGPGDVMICVPCGVASIMNDDGLSLRPMTDAERAETAAQVASAVAIMAMGGLRP